MNAIFHAINIGTLATWLSVTGFGTVAGFIPVWHPESRKPQLLDALPVSHDFSLGAEESGMDAPSESPPVNSDLPVETLPAPPELPALAESQPLPEIPDLPAPKPAESPAATPTPVAAKPLVRSDGSNRPNSAARSSTNSSKPSSGSVSGGGNSSATGSSSGSGMSNAARLAAGRMNSPSYPAYSRRNNQTGTVLVEFTVDTSGRVISAYAKKSSSWPLLDNEAVRTVRNWKFPPGGVMKLQRPIVFRLN